MKKLGMQLEGIRRSYTKNNDGNWADLFFMVFSKMFGIYAQGTLFRKGSKKIPA